jgi:hypothetical protein
MPRKKFDSDLNALYVGGPLDGRVAEKAGPRGPWKLVRNIDGEPVTAAQAIRDLCEPVTGGIYVYTSMDRPENGVLHTYVHTSILHAWYAVAAAQA